MGGKWGSFGSNSVMPKATTSQDSADTPSREHHPTKEHLISTVCALLDSQAPNAVTVGQVLQVSGISKGSLYHHFEDFSHLLEVSLVRGFTTSVDQSIAVISAVVHQSANRDEFYRGLMKVTEATQAPNLRLTRFKRARIVVLTDGNERLGKIMALEQQRLTDALTDLVAESQRKGWINPKLDARASAVLIQAYTLGKIVDDLALNPMDPQKWNDLITTIMYQVFGTE